MARRQPPARARHGDGLPDPDRGRLGRRASVLARPLAQRLSFWRDLGYAIGALSAGLIADTFGFAWAISSVGALTFISGVVVAVAMREPKKS